MNSIIPLIKELERIYELLAKDFSLKCNNNFELEELNG